MQSRRLYKLISNTTKAEGSTLLEKFILDRLRHYEEPQRKGTERGQRIGLSGAKYLASLLMLTNIQQKELAAWIQVSFGLFRKWNTEGIFKEAVENHNRDFSDKLLAFLKAKEAVMQNKIAVKDGHSRRSLATLFPELEDISLYGESVFINTGKILHQFIKTLSDDKASSNKIGTYYSLMWAMTEIEGLPEWERKRIGLSYTGYWLDRLREIQDRYRDQKEWPEAKQLLDLIERWAIRRE